MNMTVSGIDGSGKTTFCQYLKNKESDAAIVHTRLPAPLRPLSLIFLAIIRMLGFEITNLYPRTNNKKIRKIFSTLTYFEMLYFTIFMRFLHRNRTIIWDRCHLDIIADICYYSRTWGFANSSLAKKLKSLFIKPNTESYLLHVGAIAASGRKPREHHSIDDLDGRQRTMFTIASKKTYGSFLILKQKSILKIYKEAGVFPELWNGKLGFDWNGWYESNRYNRTLLRSYNAMDDIAQDMIPKHIQDKIKSYEDYVYDSLQLMHNISGDFHANHIPHIFTKTMENFPDIGHDADIYFPKETQRMDQALEILKTKYNAIQLPQSVSEKITGKYNFQIPGHELIIELHRMFMSQVGEDIKMNSLANMIPLRKQFDMRGKSFIINVSSNISTHFSFVLHAIYRHYRLRYCDILQAREMVAEFKQVPPVEALIIQDMKLAGLYPGFAILYAYGENKTIKSSDCPIFLPKRTVIKLWLGRIHFFLKRKQYSNTFKYSIIYPTLLVSMFITHKLFKKNWTW